MLQRGLVEQAICLMRYTDMSFEVSIARYSDELYTCEHHKKLHYQTLRFVDLATKYIQINECVDFPTVHNSTRKK